MSIYKIIDRFALVLALTTSGLFFAMGEYETSIAMLALWPMTRAMVLIIDVFFMFFTEKPLVRVFNMTDQRPTN
jgi:hypothetical protein